MTTAIGLSAVTAAEMTFVSLVVNISSQCIACYTSKCNSALLLDLRLLPGVPEIPPAVLSPNAFTDIVPDVFNPDLYLQNVFPEQNVFPDLLSAAECSGSFWMGLRKGKGEVNMLYIALHCFYSTAPQSQVFV